MTNEVEQSQKGGSHSTNVQIFQAGMTVAETRSLVLDVVQAELYKYQRTAEVTAQARYEKIADDVVAMVASKGGVGASAFEDPDIQYSANIVGREYARTGDDELGNVLVGLLGDRIDAQPRSLLAVVLNDAIQTAARLTDRELDALSLIWRMTRTIWLGMNGLETLRKFALSDLAPFTLPEGDASYYHLESLGCITIQPLGETKYGVALLNTYPGIFSKGFSQEEIPEELKELVSSTNLFAKCLRDLEKLQINAPSERMLEEMIATAGAETHSAALKTLDVAHRMSAQEVEAEIADIDPILAAQIDVWNKSEARHARPSAVGIAIAHSNYRRVTGLNAPLSVWIS